MDGQERSVRVSGRYKLRPRLKPARAKAELTDPAVFLGQTPVDLAWFPPGAKIVEGFVWAPEPMESFKIWYQIVGAEYLDSGKPPLLCLHGGPGAAHDYFLALGLAAVDRAVIFYDQLGRGNSSRPPKRKLEMYATIPYFAREVVHVRKALELEERDVHLFGSSWGSILAVEYLLRYHPPHTLSVTLGGPTLCMPRFARDCASMRSLLPARHRAALDEGDRTQEYDTEAFNEAVDEFYARHLCRTKPMPGYVVGTFGKLGPYGYMNGPTEFTIVGTIKDYDRVGFTTADLKNINVPVLYTCGDYDEASPAAAALYHQLTPGFQLAVFPGTAHCHHGERADLFQGVLRRFLGENEKKSN